jgi:hypothetical protein
MSTDMTDRLPEHDTEEEEVQTTGHLGLKIVGMLLAGVVALVLVAFAVQGQELPEDPEALTALLASEDAEISRRAGEELARSPRVTLPYLERAVTTDGAAELLQAQGVEATDENVETLRINVIGVLVDVRTSQALTQITPLVTDPNQNVQMEAIDAVSRMAFLWREEAASALAKAFRQSDQQKVVVAAGSGLQQMDFPAAREVLRETFRTGEGLQAVVAARMIYESETSDEAAAFLIRAVGSDDEQVAEAARQSIKKLGPQLVPELVEAASAPARKLVDDLRDNVLIKDLAQTLDARKADKLLTALGYIADQKSMDVMQESFTNPKNESSWRLAAADAMAMAARRNPGVKSGVVATMNQMLENEGETDDRIKIGAAIALARLGRKEGVNHLLNELDQFQADIAEETDRAKIEDLHALRIRAQEALAEAGKYGASRNMIVTELTTRAVEFEKKLPELRNRIREITEKLTDLRAAEQSDTAQIEELEAELAALKHQRAGGFTVLWAAAETLGELEVDAFVPNLGRYLNSTHEPFIRVAEDGSLRATSGDGQVNLVLENWRNPDPALVESKVERLRLFDYPASVRTSAAIALDKIGGSDAAQLLKEAQGKEQNLVQRLEANRSLPDYYRRASVIEAFRAQHESVLFYLNSALRRREDV